MILADRASLDFPFQQNTFVGNSLAAFYNCVVANVILNSLLTHYCHLFLHLDLVLNLMAIADHLYVSVKMLIMLWPWLSLVYIKNTVNLTLIVFWWFFIKIFIFHSQTFFYNFLPFYWGRHNLHWRLPRRRYLFQKILFLGLQRLQSCCLLFIVCSFFLVFVFYTFWYSKKKFACRSLYNSLLLLKLNNFNISFKLIRQILKHNHIILYLPWKGQGCQN